MSKNESRVKNESCVKITEKELYLKNTLCKNRANKCIKITENKLYKNTLCKNRANKWIMCKKKTNHAKRIVKIKESFEKNQIKKKSVVCTCEKLQTHRV